MLAFFNTVMFLTICLNSTCLCFCLYQLTVDTSSLSYLQLYKFVAELSAVALEYYYLCHCSEKLDDCHIKLQRSIEHSLWYRCSRSTRKNLIMFLRYVQRPNHMKFNQGAIVLSRVFFLSVMKYSYSFVNALKLMNK
uniref:Uncharacterized protein n=1 Tax=Cacopsylla melanoneura TaxID=428564 RepID=A0A8D8TPK1_9HEMI